MVQIPQEEMNTRNLIAGTLVLAAVAAAVIAWRYYEQNKKTKAA